MHRAEGLARGAVAIGLGGLAWVLIHCGQAVLRVAVRVGGVENA